MAMTLEVIRTLTTRGRTEGVDAARRELEGYAKAQEGVASSADGMRVSNDNATKSVLSAAKSFDALERKIDPVVRANATLALEQAKVQRALNEGSVSAERAEKVLSLLGARHEAAIASTQVVSSVMNDNAKVSALQAHQWLNLSRQGQDLFTMLAMGASPMQVITSQGAQIYDVFASSSGGATAALKEFGAVATRALFSPIGAAAALAAGIAAVSFEAGKTQKALAELAAQSRSTGLSAETLQGGKVIGGGVGLDEKASLGAFGAAGKQFEAYSRNSGSVLSTLQQVDKAFLGVLDKSRSATEFVDLLNEKIARSPTRQAEQLAAALYGDEAAKRLLDAIRAGEVSMRALHDASGATGQSLGQSASAAEQMQNRIAAAAAEADAKLLVAMRNIKSPTDDIKIGWYGVVGAIADAVTQSEKLQRTMSAMTSWSALFKEIGRGYDAVDKMLGARPVVSLQDANRPRMAAPGEIPFPNFAEAKAGFLPKLTNPGVGETRHLFEKETARGGGKSTAEREAEKYAKITAELEGQIRLASSLGVEHERVSLELKIQAEQAKLGAAAIGQHKQHVGDLVTQLDAARKAQKKFKEEVAATNEAYASVSNTLAGGIKDVLLKGAKPKDVLQNALGLVQNNLFDAALTGSGPFAKAFGLNGKDGAVGGLFGGLGDLLGIGSGGLDKMTIQAREVKLTQAGTGGSVGGIFGGQKYFSSPLFGGGGGFLKGLFGLADGGIMTGAGPLPLHRYAGGGIANSPQLAMFGEGRRPEAYVPLPDGRRIPAVVDMRGFGESLGALNAAQQRSVAAALTAARGASNNNRGKESAPVYVNIQNAPPGARVRESTDQKGGKRIDISFPEMMARSMGDPRVMEALRSANGGAGIARKW